MPWRRLALHMARKIAANPEARTKAIDMAKKAAQEAKQIAAAPSPARAAGTVRRLGEQLRRKIETEG